MSTEPPLLADAPLAPTVRRLRAGRTSLASALADCRDRLEAVEPRLRALVPEPDRWSRLETAAAELDARYPDPADRPPLFGVPVGIKDVVRVDGLPTRAGSELPSDALAGPEASAVTRLRDAGALVLGKTVTAEFAHFEPGPTRNPHDLGRTPGGSSSGSAAAVAAGICPLALGTQTIGSVIRPAAFCGVVGFKPSYARIPADGVVAVAPSVDTVGTFTQDVPGAALAAAVLCRDWTAVDPDGRPTLGVPAGPYLDRASDEGVAGFERAVATLEAAGYDVRRVPAFEEFDAIEARHRRLVAAEAALSHHERFAEYGDLYAEETADLVRTGREVSVGDLATARAGRLDLRAGLEATMDERGIDLWVAPSAPGPAPAGIETTGDPIMNLPWTHAGLPALSVPAGKVRGLPLGLQVVGRFGADERLLAWGEGIAAVLG